MAISEIIDPRLLWPACRSVSLTDRPRGTSSLSEILTSRVRKTQQNSSRISVQNWCCKLAITLAAASRNQHRCITQEITEIIRFSIMVWLNDENFIAAFSHSLWPQSYVSISKLANIRWYSNWAANAWHVVLVTFIPTICSTTGRLTTSIRVLSIIVWCAKTLRY